MSPLAEALDRLVPPFDESGEAWDDVLARANEDRRQRRRRLLLALATLGTVAVLLATPAFGLRGVVTGLLGRIDVPFSGHPAPTEIKASFYDLGLGAPRSMSPGVIASQTRKVATFQVNGKTHVLWVAPTRSGGFCWEITGASSSCRTHRTLPKTPVRGRVVPALLGATWELRYVDRVQSVSRIGGDILARAARRLVLRYADGSSADVPFYFVSAPINAGFYFVNVPKGHDTAATRVVAIEALDKDGKVVARQAFPYMTAAQLAKDRARHIGAIRSAQAHRPQAPPTTGEPTPPVQRGRSRGVTVVAGANGVVVFDLAHASATARRLLGDRSVSYGCIRRLPYHPSLVSLGQWAGVRYGRVVIRLGGNFGPPYDGCEIQGSYGHTWPDTNASHSAVELAFTPAGHRFFDERATARDLAAFIRSQPFRGYRDLSGADLERALRTSRYATKVTRLAYVTAPIRPHRIGYVIQANGATFIEESARGRRFQVRVADGVVRSQNLAGLARAFF